jgi:hypothetical protein
MVLPDTLTCMHTSIYHLQPSLLEWQVPGVAQAYFCGKIRCARHGHSIHQEETLSVQRLSTIYELCLLYSMLHLLSASFN